MGVSAEAQTICLAALTIAGEEGEVDIAKPLPGLGSGVWEMAIRFAGDAFRLVYTLQPGNHVWVVHAFQKNRPRASRRRQVRSGRVAGGISHA